MQQGQTEQAEFGNVGAFRATLSFIDLNAPTIKLFRLIVLPQLAVKISQIVGAASDCGMIGPEIVFINLQAALHQRFRLGVFSIVAIIERQIGKTLGYIRMVWSELSLANF